MAMKFCEQNENPLNYANHKILQMQILGLSETTIIEYLANTTWVIDKFAKEKLKQSMNLHDLLHNLDIIQETKTQREKFYCSNCKRKRHLVDNCKKRQ